MEVVLFILIPVLVSSFTSKIVLKRYLSINNHSSVIFLISFLTNLAIIETSIFFVFGYPVGVLNVQSKLVGIAQGNPSYPYIYSLLIFSGTFLSYVGFKYIFDRFSIKKIDLKFSTCQRIVLIIVTYLWISLYWVKSNFSVTDIESILFHLGFVNNETNLNLMVFDFLFNTFTWLFVLTLFIFLINKNMRLDKTQINKFYNFGLILILALMLVVDAWQTFQITEFLENRQNPSEFIENNYVDPNQVELDFPDEPKNLILIYLESMEFTYSKSDYFGSNLIPELSGLALEYPSFSFDNNQNGILQIDNASGTISGLFTSSTGLPFKPPLQGSEIISNSVFMPNVITLGDILAHQDYNQTFLIGSDGDFGNRKSFYENHGDYYVNDYYEAIKDGRIPEDYNVWWGYEDKKLFEFAKEEINHLSNYDEPFNLTLLTTDTHAVDGYLDETCASNLSDQYSNVIKCADERVANFIEWIKSQDFYANTTVVVLGDHLSMDPFYFSNVSSQRSLYNVFIGEHLENSHSSFEKEATQLDLMPTMLASMGIEIDGNQLALGVNLFSDKQTLTEKYGYEFLNSELKRISSFYYEEFLTID